MAAPTSYPTWRFYQDGRMLLVHTPQEYADLPPGHSDRQDGPWAARDAPQPAGEALPEPDLHARALALRAAGRGRKAIAEALGVTEYTIRRLLEDP